MNTNPLFTEEETKELEYCAALVRTGGDSPRVPHNLVDQYLMVQYTQASKADRPNMTLCLVLLQMIRAQPDEELQSRIWLAFWRHVRGY